MPGRGPRGETLLRWMIAFTVIVGVILLLRLWAARLMKRSFYLDDLFVLIAFASTITFEGVAVWAIDNGAGKPQADLTPEELAIQAKILVLPSSIAWLVGTVAIKFSVLWLYTRIFSTRSFKNWSYSLMAVVACYFVAFLAVFMTICKPIDQLWNPVPWGSCRDTSDQEFTSISFNLVVDLAIFVLPMPWLWGLKMPLRNKIAISVMFSIGLVTIGVMCWRLAATKDSIAHPDASYHTTDIALISLLELWLGMIVASIPTLAPLLQKYVKPVITKVTMHSSGSRYPKNQYKLSNYKESHSSRRYQNIDTSTSQYDVKIYANDLQGSTQGLAITTECTHDPAIEPPRDIPTPGQIHVRRDIESQNW